jgi:hypothetical protein
MSLDQNMPFAKSIQGLLEEAVESSKTGGAVIVIALDGLFYPKLPCRMFSNIFKIDFIFIR